MNFLTKSILAFGILISFNFAYAQEAEGVLVLAHGSVMGHFNQDYPRDKSQCQIVREHQRLAEHQWENAICTVIDELNRIKKTPLAVEVGFGMTSVDSFQHAVDRLVNSGMTKLRIIPLYISTYSDVIREQKEIFGLQPFVDGHEHGRVVLPKTVTKVIYENALDDAQELSNALLYRARELSRTPQFEELVLVGHGPQRYEDDLMWVRNFNTHNQRIQNELMKSGRHFAVVHAITVQDDAPTDVREQKTRALRQIVSQASQRGHRALILPVLIAPGSIEKGIVDRLRGLTFGYVGHMLTPDPEITSWVNNQINKN